MTATTQYMEPIEEIEFREFYQTTETKDGTKVTIQPLQLIDCLKYLGFRRMDVGDRSFIIRITDNIVEEVNDVRIVDIFEEYLDNWPDFFPDGGDSRLIRNKLYNGLGRFFSTSLLYRLNTEPQLTIQNHTREAAFFYYKNCFVEVAKDGIQKKPYSQLTGKIWKDQILDRNFREVTDYESCTFARFVSNIANNWEKRWYDGEKNPDRSPKRYRQFKQIIGNCLHSYAEGKMRAIVFTDSRTDDEASGRTGKTLIMKAMGHMLNAHRYAKTYAEVNGKDFDPRDRFKWQELSVDTRLVHLNDVEVNFQFDTLFNDITEGIKVQKKNEAPFIVRAKLVLSTNRTIKIHGDSAQDRSIEFEMADYYAADNGPDREFGEWFFRDWDEAAWNSFDNFMMHCVQLFLRNGVEVPDTINLETRKMKEETSPEFVEWMEDKYRNLAKEEHDVRELRDSFVDMNPDFDRKKWFDQRRFNKWVKLYAQYHPKINCIHMRPSNGRQLVRFELCEENEPNIELPAGW
jgi:hypothetical protein